MIMNGHHHSIEFCGHTDHLHDFDHPDHPDHNDFVHCGQIYHQDDCDLRDHSDSNDSKYDCKYNYINVVLRNHYTVKDKQL